MSLLSLCMIMKDEEAELPIVLASASKFVDEVVIYDTGSTDSSVPLARSLGATVIEGYWDADFARARNAALEHCHSEWILWLDADESLHGDADAFRRRLSGDQEFDTYLLPIESIEGAGLAAHSVFRAARVFRRRTCHWYGPIHEQIGRRDDDSVPATTLGVELRILHRGYTQLKSEGKDLIQRNLAIAKAALDDPTVDRARALFDYGRTMTQTDDPERGIELLREAVERSPVGTLRRAALRIIFFTQLGQGDFDGAEETLEQLRSSSTRTVAVDSLRARLLLGQEEYERCVELIDTLPFVDTDEDGMEYGRNTVAQIKAQALAALGRHAEAADTLLETLRTHGQLDCGLETVVDLLRAAGRSPVEIVERARPESMPVLAAMAGTLDPLVADDLLSAFVDRYPDRLEPLAAAVKIAPRLSVARAMWWSDHLRRSGLGDHCPLACMVDDTELDVTLRLGAAAGGYLAFGDQRLVEPARRALRSLPVESRSSAMATVAGISPELAELLGTQTVALRLEASTELTALPDASVHELDAGAQLSFSSHDGAGAVLAEWARIVAPRGRLHLEVPDLDGVAELLRAGELADARTALFGAHPAHAPHRDGWTSGEIERHLAMVGFDIESVVPVPAPPTLRVTARRRVLACRPNTGPVPPVSVVLVADDAAEALLSRLRSLATVPTGIDFETVVFANGPDAAVLRVLDALSGDVTLASSPVRLDPAAAINEAVRMARAEIVTVINGNPVLTDGWLAGLVRAASADHVGLVGPQLLQTTGVLRHAGFDLHAAGGPTDTVVASARGTYLSPTHPRVAGDAAVDALGEDCVAFRAETWRRLGGIAAGWPLHEAVIDLGLRARLAGLSCIAVSDSRIIEGAARATAAESDRLGRHWIGRTDFAPLPAPRRSLSALMPTTTLIERLAGDYPISDTPRGDGINLVSEEHRAETEAWADALHATGVTVANHSWDGGALRYPDTAPFPFAATLLVLDGEVLTDYLAEAGIDSLRHRYTALAWDWPFEVASQDVGAISTTVNEIWVPSSFSKRALAAVSARPVLYVPPPLSFGPVPAAALDHLPDQVKFVTVARIGRGRDLDVEMTNPVGVIEAFRSAFRDGAGPTLQVVVTGRHRAEGLKRCTEVAAGRTDVSIVELSDDRHIAATVVDAHCAVSLHRSSAFNLDLARALAAGRPVISTAYGGPMDYLNAGVADLVGYRPVPIPGSGGSGSGSGASRLPAGASWAEPSRREAVAALRRVNDDYRQACQRAWLGRQLLNRSYGRRPVLQVLNRRLMPLRATSTRRDAQNRKSVGKS